MALIQCPDCGRQVSDVAPSCPGCGRPLGVAYAAPSTVLPPAVENVFFQDQLVIVTSSRIMLAKTGATYVMANVTAVHPRIAPRDGKFIFAAVALVATALICVYYSAWVLAVILAVVAAVMVVAYIESGPLFWIRLNTAGADMDFVSSKNEAWAQSVLAAINQALVATQRH
jgi:hypothetical protein